MAARHPPRRGASRRFGAPEPSRKTIHIIASVAAAVAVLELPPALAPWLFVGTFLVAIAVEEARRYSQTFGRIFQRALGGMLRPGELRGITGATTLAAGFAIAVILLPPPFAAAGILVAGIGDAAAAIVGLRWGRHRLPSGKSLEGTLAFFVAALPAAWIVPAVGFVPAVVTAAFAAVLELLPVPFDDNLWLAPAAGVIAWAAAAPIG